MSASEPIQRCERVMKLDEPSLSTGDAAITIVYGPESALVGDGRGGSKDLMSRVSLMARVSMSPIDEEQ